MPVLNDYHHFDGLHWETGPVRNFLDYQGVSNPYTGEPYSEAFFLGVSGGAVVGYFSFAYEGYDPMARILTRNTFDPFDTMLSRLGVVQNIMRTAKPEQGRLNLLETLESGLPAIVWADVYSLPYNAHPPDAGMWLMWPILVYGYAEQNDRVWIADRARLPLTVTAAELASARGRVKKDKFQLLTLDPPLPEKLPGAVQAGIWDCINLYTEKPPRGTPNNFGLAALRFWSDLLVKPKARLGWERVFPAGQKFYAGLTSAFHDINLFGKDGQAERDVYARFLDEAALILNKPALRGVAERFHAAGRAWDDLSLALLPDDVPLFGETRRLMLRRHQRFLEAGNAAVDEMRTIDRRLVEIREAITPDQPLDSAAVAELRQAIRDRLLAVHDREEQAVTALRKAMS